MPRHPRIKSSIGMEHVMFRGINKERIFVDDTDRKKFLKCIRESNEKAGFILHAYCLMGNHVHLLIQQKDESVSEIVKRMTISYAAYFNKRHNRVGHLFQDRFRSVPVEREDSYLRVMRYIFQNPVKAGICARVEDYRWSSYHTLGRDDGLTDSRLVNKIAEPDYIKTFMNMVADDADLDEIERSRVTDPDVVDIMRAVSGVEDVAEFLELDEVLRLEYIEEMLRGGCKGAQIVRVLGISEYQVRKVMGKRR